MFDDGTVSDGLASRRSVLQGLGLAGVGPVGIGVAGANVTAADSSNAATGDDATAAADGEPDREAITFEAFVGINAFVDDPVERMAVAGFVREYHNWHWDEGDVDDYPGYPDNEIKWAPSYAGGGYWNFDDYYSSLVDAGVQVSPCIQDAPGWLRDDGDGRSADVPVDEVGADATDPQSYEAKAHHAFQFAARYGDAAVEEELLTLAPDQPVESGLGLVDYLEDWNEPNRWWDGEDAEFSPAEYAAMSSAAYDGHANTLEGPTGTYGVKNADPSMQYVMGGIAGHSLEWIQAIDDWYREHRPDGEFVPDVINVHHYSQDDENPGAPALSPEEDDFRGRLETLTDWRDEHYPDVEVWISEFGYDTHPESPVRPPVVGDFTREQLQGAWIVRAYLAFAAAGVDRAQQYMLRDVNPDDATQYSTSGLVTQKGEWEPKPSWFYVATMRDALWGTQFHEELDAGRDDVRIYAFEQRDGDGGAYAVWCPTADAVTVPAYELDLLGEPSEATLVELEDGSETGATSELAIEDGVVAVDVSERPVFVQVDDLGGGEAQPCEAAGAEASETLADGSTVCDVDGDGNYMDVTGDGSVTNSDVTEFFGTQHVDPWNGRADLFDFTGDDRVGQADVVELFRTVAE